MARPNRQNSPIIVRTRLARYEPHYQTIKRYFCELDQHLS